MTCCQHSKIHCCQYSKRLTTAAPSTAGAFSTDSEVSGAALNPIVVYVIDIQCRLHRIHDVLTDHRIASLCVDFGRRVQVARKKKGLSPSQLATLIGLARTSVANIESGRQRVPIHILWRLSDALGTPVSELVPEISKPNAGRFSEVVKRESKAKQVSVDGQRRLRAFIAGQLEVAENSADDTSA